MAKTKKSLIALVSVLALCITVSVLAQSAATILPKSATGAYMADWGAGGGNGRALALNATDGWQESPRESGGGSGQRNGVSPPLPFMISGYVFYADGTACSNPSVNITKLNTSKKWTAETNEAANYYQLVLNGTTEVTAGDRLWFDVADETQTNTTEHTVILDDIDMGGLYKFNITLESLTIHDINVSTDYPLPYSSTGIKIIKDGTEIEDSQNLTIGEGYMIRSRIVNEGDFDENVSVTMNIINETAVIQSWDITGRAINKTEYSDFWRTWNTSGLSPGYYTIFVNASIVGYADAHPENNNRTRIVGLEIAAEPELTSISVSPETAALNVTDTQQFTATAYDQYGKEMHDVVFTWRSTNETVGTINETTGLFTAIAPGTATVMAYNAPVGQSVNGTAEVTVNETARIPGDVNGDTEINIQDAVLLFNWVSFPSERGITYILAKPENANVNGDAVTNIQDAVLLFNWVSFPSERGTTYILQ